MSCKGVVARLGFFQPGRSTVKVFVKKTDGSCALQTSLDSSAFILLAAQTSQKEGEDLWSSYVRQFGIPPFAPQAPAEVARFTTSMAITIQRVEVRLEQGPFLSDESGPCTTTGTVQISDGARTLFTLPLAPASTISTGPTGGSYTDSGPISIHIPAGTALSMQQTGPTPVNTNPACLQMVEM